MDCPVDDQLGERHAFLLGNRPDLVQEAVHLLAVVGLEGQRARAVVTFLKFIIVGDLAGQEPPLQRAVGQDAFAVLQAIGHQLRLYLSLHHAVGHLVYGNVYGLLSRPHLVGGVVADAGRPDLALLHQPGHRLHGLFNGRGRVSPVNLVQVYVVGL